jgi:preprotein translocase subunit Sss1
MPQKTDPKRLEWNKQWLAKKLAEDPDYAKKRQEYLKEYRKFWREKKMADPVWAEKERERQRKAKRDQYADPIRGAKLREALGKRHKERLATDSAYRDKQRQYSMAKYYRETQADKIGARIRQLRKRCRDHGITLDDYDRMWEEQKGVCKICKRPETREYHGILCCLSIDHCHETGRVRGLLCDACNTGIGRLDDSPERLRAAITYLSEI